MVKVQVSVPAAFDAMHCTGVSPSGNVAPLRWLHCTDPQDADALKVAIAPHVPVAVERLRDGGQLMTGGRSALLHTPAPSQRSGPVQGLPSLHDVPAASGDQAVCDTPGRQARQGFWGCATCGNRQTPSIRQRFA